MRIADTEITVDLSPAGSNTVIDYDYRDGSGYAVSDRVVLEGVITPEQLDIIAGSLSDSEFFIPSQVGLRDLQGDFEAGKGWSDDDHVWHTIASISTTAEPATETPKVVSVSEMMARWPRSARGWDLVGALERAQGYVPSARF